MSLPYFFAPHIGEANTELTLEEDTAKHIVQVLRMKEGDELMVTDGRGHLAHVEMVFAYKKNCTVRILSASFEERASPELTIAISLIKNTGRFEWFLEKAAELGTANIIPMICSRTEKQFFRHDRFVNICRSAMLQSSQSWLTQVYEPLKFADVVSTAQQQQKYIGHLMEGQKKSLVSEFDPQISSHIMLIGPEGDFTAEEVKLAMNHNFIPVTMGNTRLRVETAGIYTAAVCRR